VATFDPIFAADPDNPELIAQNASVIIFDPDDPAKTPVSIMDVSGVPLPNPITVNEKGWGPAFKTPDDEDELFRVAWEGAGFNGFFTSYESMRDTAVAAKADAAASASNAAAAQAAAEAAAAAAEVAAEAATGGGVAEDPLDADVLILTTKSDGSVIVDPADADALIITT
jgi:hypothetical protein